MSEFSKSELKDRLLATGKHLSYRFDELEKRITTFQHLIDSVCDRYKGISKHISKKHNENLQKIFSWYCIIKDDILFVVTGEVRNQSLEGIKFKNDFSFRRSKILKHDGRDYCCAALDDFREIVRILDGKVKNNEKNDMQLSSFDLRISDIKDFLQQAMIKLCHHLETRTASNCLLSNEHNCDLAEYLLCPPDGSHLNYSRPEKSVLYQLREGGLTSDLTSTDEEEDGIMPKKKKSRKKNQLDDDEDGNEVDVSIDSMKRKAGFNVEERERSSEILESELGRTDTLDETPLHHSHPVLSAFDRGKEEEKRGDYRNAIASFEEDIDSAHESDYLGKSTALCHIARCHMNLENSNLENLEAAKNFIEESLKLADKALDENKGMEEIHQKQKTLTELGNLYLKLYDHDNADKHLEKATSYYDESFKLAQICVENSSEGGELNASSMAAGAAYNLANSIWCTCRNSDADRVIVMCELSEQYFKKLHAIRMSLSQEDDEDSDEWGIRAENYVIHAQALFHIDPSSNVHQAISSFKKALSFCKQDDDKIEMLGAIIDFLDELDDREKGIKESTLLVLDQVFEMNEEEMTRHPLIQRKVKKLRSKLNDVVQENPDDFEFRADVSFSTIQRSNQHEKSDEVEVRRVPSGFMTGGGVEVVRKTKTLRRRSFVSRKETALRNTAHPAVQARDFSWQFEALPLPRFIKSDPSESDQIDDKYALGVWQSARALKSNPTGVSASDWAMDCFRSALLHYGSIENELEGK